MFGDSNLQVSSVMNESKSNITIFDLSIMLWAFGMGVGVGSGVGVEVAGDDAVGVLTKSELFGVATSDPCESEADPLHPNKNKTIVDMKICRYRDFIGQLHRNIYSLRMQMPYRHEKQLI